MNNLRSWKKTWKIQVWLTERCVRLSQGPGFGSRSILNFFRFFFNRFGCSFYCEDHVHFHTLSNQIAENILIDYGNQRKQKNCAFKRSRKVALFISGLKWTCKDFSFRSRSIETHRWMALRTVNQVTKWVDWAVLILGASSVHACLSNLCFIYAYTLTTLFPCGRL